MTEKKSNNKRSTNWTFVLYPTEIEPNTPIEWRDILNDLKVEWALSPYHEFDTNPDTGEIKKAHYHVLLSFTRLKSYEQILTITQSVNATIPQICHNVKGLLRYFIHLDNPEKYQYNQSDISYLNGFDSDKYMSKTATENKALLKEIVSYIIENDITEYSDLIEHSFFNNNDWYDLLTSNYTLFLTGFLKSRHYRKYNKEVQND